MREAFVRLLCPECNSGWEENPTDMPPPGELFECSNCGAARPTAEFMRTTRDLEILEEFHE